MNSESELSDNSTGNSNISSIQKKSKKSYIQIESETGSNWRFFRARNRFCCFGYLMTLYAPHVPLFFGMFVLSIIGPVIGLICPMIYFYKEKQKGFPIVEIV